ncbi:hypothetical protein [Flavobacterium tegetincola]|uniref:hypothetical protein n=1 Tax=Flavobacterium tegetincola TaxID=150172 RepID=UPI0004090D2D|nr:hypothetical protein [Flavobacterium tegetincola]
MLKATTSKRHFADYNFNVISALVLFFLLFQVQINAQNPIEKETSKRYPTSIEAMIRSTTTDDELEAKSTDLSNQFGLEMKLKKVKRDKNELIKTIHIILSDDKGSKQVYDVSADEPIQPFAIFVRIDEHKEMTFGYNDASISLLIDENSNNQRAADSLFATEKEAAAVKKLLNSENKANDEAAALPDNHISSIKLDKNINYKNAFISLNGKEITSDALDKIDPETIGSVRKLNRKNNENLVAQYGEKARNGAILIETMFILKPLSSAEIEALPATFKLDIEDGAFIIHKESQDSDIAFYKKHLAEVGVILYTSELQRGSNGDIIALKIKLDDELQNVKMSNWIPFKNANGIENVFVGRQNGKINVSTR